MSISCKCTSCSTSVSFADRAAALAMGWTFVTIESKPRSVKYIVSCEACRPSWLSTALGEKTKERKMVAKS